MSLYCPKCKESIHGQESRFCWKDGTELQNRKIHGCGHELSPYDVFCPVCGDLIEEPYKPTKEDLRADDRLLDHLESMEGV
jgi:hypothetical protein